MGTALFLCFFSLGTFAAPLDKATWGVEFTLSNQRLMRVSEKEWETNESAKVYLRSLKKAFLNHLKEVCSARGCEVRGKRVSYSDGWFFEVNTDISAIEINPHYATLEEWRGLKDRIQRDIFDTGEKLGLYPDFGGGHIHLGRDAFLGRDLLHRNFIVDQMNHIELATGALGSDFANAVSFFHLPRLQRKNFIQALALFDRGEIDREAFDFFINRQVYRYPSKYYAVNLDHRETVELRAIYTHMNAQNFIKVLTLLQKRLEFLAEIKTPILFVEEIAEATRLPDLRTRKALFRAWVEETGLRWKDYEDLLPDAWVSRPEGPGTCKRLMERILEATAA